MPPWFLVWETRQIVPLTKVGKVEGEADGLGKTKMRMSHSEFEM